MRTQQTETVIPLAPRSQTPENNDQLDQAGRSILQLLHKAAGVTEQNSRHAFDVAQKLSHQLRAAEDRITELEGEVASYQDQLERAGQWLHKAYTEIEDRFLKQQHRRN